MEVACKYCGVSWGCTVFSTTCTNPYQGGVQQTHPCLSQTFFRATCVLEDAKRVNTTNLSSGMSHFYSTIPLSITFKARIRCPPATSNCTFTVYHHQCIGDSCYLHFSLGKQPHKFPLLCIRQNAKAPAQTPQTVWNNLKDLACSGLAHDCWRQLPLREGWLWRTRAQKPKLLYARFRRGPLPQSSEGRDEFHFWLKSDVMLYCS